MTPSYTLAYRRKFSPITRKVPNVIGHSWDQRTDKLWIQTADRCFEVFNWSKCCVSLGKDWIEYVREAEKKKIEAAAKVKEQ